ncbi:MAG: 4Fe-4S ferredoxin [Chloroflexi bacterium]|nr:4Fe-4S ferredoxin [Chloroflexota bacterium]
MAYRITRDCIACGMCILQCVNRAIYVNTNDRYAINSERCTECIELGKRRCHLICTVGAIQPDPAHQETKAVLWEKLRHLPTIPTR